MKSLAFIFIFLTCFLGWGLARSDAQGIITFGPRETSIDGTIAYTVLGEYQARFRSFQGIIRLGQQSQRIQSVYLKIDVDSIVSNCPLCDRLARSRRLLNSARYPRIIFKSNKIIFDGKGYQVKGILEMHGVKKAMTFPFRVKMMESSGNKMKILALYGSWRINRKDFNIVWNRYLDNGGVLVGDIFTVHWGIKVNLPLLNSKI